MKREQPNAYQPMESRSRGITIMNRYPDIVCALEGCGKVISDRKNKNQKYCSRQHRELARKGKGK